VVALAASPFYYRQVFFRVEEEIRARAEAKIAERFPDLEVHVQSARLANNGIEVRGISLIEPNVVGPQPELAYFDEVFLACSTNLQELVSGDPVITNIKLIRPIIRATRRPDGRFHLDKLRPVSQPENPLPPLSVDSGIVEIFDPLKNPSSTLTLRDVHVSLRPTDEVAGQLAVTGYFVGDHLQRVEIAGTLDPASSTWSLQGSIDGLQISSGLRNSMPGPIASSMELLKSVHAPANLSFSIRHDGIDALPQFEVNGTIAGGRIEDPLLPYPLTDLEARIHCDNTGFRIRDLTAHHGPTTWTISQFDQHGYGSGKPCVLRASGRQVRLDRRWRDTLPKQYRKHWTNYDPEGDVNVECTASFDGQDWRPVLKLTALNNVSFCCYKFPYRLERGRGSLTLQNKELDVNLVAFSGAQPVTLKGKFFNPGPEYDGSIEIWGEKIQFDEPLFAAILKPKSRDAIRSLNPRGTFDFHTQLWRQPNDPLPRPLIHQHLRVSLNRCTVTYDKLPYPLYNLQGKLDMRDGQWTTDRELVGVNDTGVVTVSGKLAASPEADRLTLHVDGERIPLEEELRDALPAQQQQIWAALRPRGNIDLEADVQYDSRVRKPSIDLRMVPHGGRLPGRELTGRAPAVETAQLPVPPVEPEATLLDDGSAIGTSIAPVAFPYRIERLGGLVHYRDGQVKLIDVRGRHRATEMRADGWCVIQQEGAWQLHLDRLSVDRMRLDGDDRELVSALPAALRQAVAELRPTGPINLKGVLEFSKAGLQAPLQSSWDVGLYLHQASLRAGPQINNVFGAVHLRGSSDGTRYSSYGQLELDSLTYRNFQLTEILGPLWFDNQNVYLGTLPFKPADGQPRGRITAKLFGGTAAADCHVRLGAVPQYRLIATLSGADLGQFAVENLTNHQALRGKILANVDLQGSRGQHTLVGRGDVHLSDADIYELPLVVSLLSIIRAKAPGPTAFTESDIIFQVNGQHVQLKQIDLRGDALDLGGHGELTLDGQTNPIALELHTTVGRGSVPIISGMFSEASQQLLKVHVVGSLEQPQAWTEALPIAGEALNMLRTDYQSPPGQFQNRAGAQAYGARR
jgi:hypothetical protein